MKVSALAFVLVVAFWSDVTAKCAYDPDPLINCDHALKKWFNDNEDHQSSSFEDQKHRTNDLRDALQKCLDCAMDRVNEGAEEANPAHDPLDQP